MPADKWIETYRGTVFRWEVDDNDHFTVAYYLARIADASAATPIKRSSFMQRQTKIQNLKSKINN